MLNLIESYLCATPSHYISLIGFSVFLVLSFFFVFSQSIWFKIKVILFLRFFSSIPTSQNSVFKRCPEWFWNLRPHGVMPSPKRNYRRSTPHGICSVQQQGHERVNTSIQLQVLQSKKTYIYAFIFFFHFAQLSYTDKYVEQQHNHTSLEEKTSKCSGNTDANWSQGVHIYIITMHG